jgi:hypothetical protein
MAKVSEIDWPHAVRVHHNGDEITRRAEAMMENVYLGTAVQVVTIVGGVVALVLAELQAAKTWLDIGEKLKKRRRGKRDKR